MQNTQRDHAKEYIQNETNNLAPNLFRATSVLLLFAKRRVFYPTELRSTVLQYVSRLFTQTSSDPFIYMKTVCFVLDASPLFPL